MSDFDDSDFEEDTADDVTFTLATEQVQRTHATLLPDDLLELYALFKQATVGRCNTTRPNIFQLQGRAKWSAWNELGDLSATEAKRRYVQKLQQLDPQWWAALKSDERKQAPTTGWVVHSVELPPADEEEAAAKPDHEKTAIDFIREGNLQRLQGMALGATQLQQLDEHGLGLLHWAADRNRAEMLHWLLASGADVNLRDAEQQTALHYAASCGHVECLRLLLGCGADRLAKDADGQTAADVADNAEVRALLEL